VLGAAIRAFHAHQEIGLVQLREIHLNLDEPILRWIAIKNACHILVFVPPPNRGFFDNAYDDKWAAMSNAVNGIASSSLADMERLDSFECHGITMNDQDLPPLDSSSLCVWPSDQVLECSSECSQLPIQAVDPALASQGLQAQIRALRRAYSSSFPSMRMSLTATVHTSPSTRYLRGSIRHSTKC
jgi:hypothetical protein